MITIKQHSEFFIANYRKDCQIKILLTKQIVRHTVFEFQLKNSSAKIS